MNRPLAIALAAGLLACGSEAEVALDSSVATDAARSDAAAPDAAGGEPDAALGACGLVGEASVTGEVADKSVAPVETAWYYAEEDVALLVIDERPSTCKFGGTEANGEALGFLFCQPLGAGSEHDVTTEFPEPCTQPLTQVVIEERGGADIASAVSGTVTVESATPSCLEGSFSLVFDDDDPESELSGSFAARVCDELILPE